MEAEEKLSQSRTTFERELAAKVQAAVMRAKADAVESQEGAQREVHRRAREEAEVELRAVAAQLEVAIQERDAEREARQAARAAEREAVDAVSSDSSASSLLAAAREEATRLRLELDAVRTAKEGAEAAFAEQRLALLQRNREQRSRLQEEMEQSCDTLRQEHAKKLGEVERHMGLQTRQIALLKRQIDLQRGELQAAGLGVTFEDVGFEEVNLDDSTIEDTGIQTAPGYARVSQGSPSLLASGGRRGSLRAAFPMPNLPVPTLPGMLAQVVSASPFATGSATPTFRPSSPTASINSLAESSSSAGLGMLGERSMSMSGVWARRHMQRRETRLRHSQPSSPTPPPML